MSAARGMLVMTAVTGCLLLCSLQPVAACTSFAIADDGDDGVRIVGKSYDWTVGTGLVMVNRRGVTKPFSFAPGPSAARWVSRYGSVSFNQYGRDNPQGGMNEQGLVIEILWLSETVYPAEDRRQRLGATQWIQYQLDTAATVGEVIAGCDRVRIASPATVHFLVADRHGDVATLEFLAGELVCHRGDDLVSPVLTNSTYDDSAAYLRRHRGWGGSRPIPVSQRSLDRFVRASDLARNCPGAGEPIVDCAFAVLDSVANPGWTRWQIVYDQRSLLVIFRTDSNPVSKRIDLASLELACSPEAMKIIDIDLADGGDLSEGWQPYTTQANRQLIERAYNGTTFLRSVSPQARDRLATYPEHTACVR